MAGVAVAAYRMPFQRGLGSLRSLHHAVPRMRTYSSMATAATVKQNCRKVRLSRVIGGQETDSMTGDVHWAKLRVGLP